MSARVIGWSNSDGLCPLRSLRRENASRKLTTRSLALLRHEGGDKVMARVLMAVPTHGLDAVLVAVELVLESGRPSAEHVLNVLARLSDDPPPPETFGHNVDAPEMTTCGVQAR